MPTMFSGNRIILPKSPAEKKEEKKISRTTFVLTAEQILKNQKYQRLLAQCEELMEFSPEQHDIYIMPLISAFVEFVQNLPETRNSYYAKPGGFISHALVRTASALSMCRAYFSTAAKDKNQRLGAQEMLWMYALFSAGIFNGVGKVFSDFVIELQDETGKLLDRWNPFENNMIEAKAHTYDYDFEDARQIDLFSRRLSVLLAKQLMPFQGFAWISSDKEVLSFWLALLEDNQRDAGTLGPFMVRADALAINTYFDEKRMQRQYSDLDVEAKAETDKIAEEKDEDADKKDQKEIVDADDENREKTQNKIEQDKEKIQLRFSATFAPPPETEKPIPGSESDKMEKRNPTTQAGIEFLKWLNNQLKAQRFEFNDSIFYMPSGAIFLPTGIFEEFRRKNPYYKSSLDVIEAFNKLELHAKNGEKSHLHTFVRTTEEGTKKIQGIILTNAQLVLPKNINVRMSNGEKHTISTTELSHYTHLFDPLQPLGKKGNLPPPAPEQRAHTGMFGGR